MRLGTRGRGELLRTIGMLLATVLGVLADDGAWRRVAAGDAKTTFKVGWSTYVGWMPWGYANDSGIVKKWADKYGLKIEITHFKDYIESVNQYTAGAIDAVTVTNLDAISIPAASGVDTTAVIVGDYSNGNDAIILKNGATLADIKGRSVNLVEFSVSHYLLARALETNGLLETDVKLVNTSDADIAGIYAETATSALVTWKPIVSKIVQSKDARIVFDSSQIPGEIIDLTVANTEVLSKNPDFGKALVGIWYETLARALSDPAAKAAMAAASGTDVAGLEEQLATTRLFATPNDALAFTKSDDFKSKTKTISQFLFDKGLLGKGADGAGSVGVAYPDASVYGSAAYVKLRYDTRYMQLAADGKL